MSLTQFPLFLSNGPRRCGRKLNLFLEEVHWNPILKFDFDLVCIMDFPHELGIDEM